MEAEKALLKQWEAIVRRNVEANLLYYGMLSPEEQAQLEWRAMPWWDKLRKHVFHLIRTGSLYSPPPSPPILLDGVTIHIPSIKKLQKEEESHMEHKEIHRCPCGWEGTEDEMLYESVTDSYGCPKCGGTLRTGAPEDGIPPDKWIYEQGCKF